MVEVIVCTTPLEIRLAGNIIVVPYAKTYEVDQIDNERANMAQKYLRVGKFSIRTVLDFLTTAPQGHPSFAGHPIHMYSKRYQVFTRKGIKCAACGLEATYFCLEKHSATKTKHYHFNLYGITASGSEVLFTKDHILPRSRGGADHIDNLQTMCSPCNTKKGNIVQ